MNSTRLLEICQAHPEFDRDKFIAEGNKIKEAGLLDNFFAICDRFFAGNHKPGDKNLCNSSIAYWAGMTTRAPEGSFIPREKMAASRVSPPDVDIDFDYFRREEVYNYLVEKYGTDYTCNIGTYNELKARATLRNVGKVADVGNDWEPGMRKAGPKTQERADELAKMAPANAKTIEDGEKENPQLAGTLGRHSNFRELCIKIQGRIVYTGVHAAGIIVSNRVVRELTPLKVSNGTVCSQYDKNELEEIGLLKFDILALKTLSVIDSTLNLIRERHGKDIDIDALEPDDENVFDILNSGLTKGIFQMEGRGITEMIRAIHVDSFEDMIASNALYRPGPLKADVPKLYYELKHGQQKVAYDHPSMEAALEPTYGLIVYQEQVMRVARDMCGFTGPQADKLRKAIGKKDEELMAAMKDKFVSGAVGQGVEHGVAQATWDKIEKFGGYGFNRSHSACYAFIAYQTAWLKRYYPHEFMCCLLTSEIGDDEKLGAYVAEAKNFNMKVFRPDINLSGSGFKLEDAGGMTCLRAPLTYIKGVGATAVAHILANQPYESLRDFVVKNSVREVTSKVVGLLIDNGCFGTWEEDKKKLHVQYEALKSEMKSRKVDPGKFSGGGLDLWGVPT